jgi:ribosome recycling factor
MKGAVESLKGDLSGLRTGRANVDAARSGQVEVYGSHMPLNQVATVFRARAPHAFGAGLGPQQRDLPVKRRYAPPGWASIPFPTARRCACRSRLTEERRKELAKLAGQYAEKAQVSPPAMFAATAWTI